MELIFTDDTIFTAVFSGFPDVQGGVYRAPIPEEILGVSHSEEGRVVLYPNPTSDAINIQLKEASTVDLIISDTMGRTVFSGSINPQGNLITIPTENWAAGMYIFSLKGKNVAQTGNFIVK